MEWIIELSFGVWASFLAIYVMNHKPAEYAEIPDTFYASVSAMIACFLYAAMTAINIIKERGEKSRTAPSVKDYIIRWISETCVIYLGSHLILYLMISA